ncbi:MAG: hypothetical protein JW727_01985 [Candidatus Aenigmarchaeota archaeon]|nr:hypothetical protein [Candidatus Aenigmarchaeota archaeon]
MLGKKAESICKVAILLVSLIVILIVGAFASINELASDSSYYGIISHQMLKEQKIVYETEDINSGRPVLYPQGYIVMNSIGLIFIGDNFNKAIIFFASLTYLFLVWSLIEKILKLKGYSQLIALILTSVLFLGSAFFYAILRYKMETFWWLFGLFIIYLAYLADTKKYSNRPLGLMFIFGAAMIAFKQIGLLVIPLLGLISLYIISRRGLKNVNLLLGLWLILAVLCAPFYLAMFESTGSLLGNPTQKVPVIDKMELNLFDVPKTAVYYKTDITPEGYSSEEVQSEDLNEIYDNLSDPRQMGLPIQGAMILALIAFSLLVLLRKRLELLLISILATILLSILGFLKLGGAIWFYFMNSNFLILLLILIFTAVSLDKAKSFISHRLLAIISALVVVVFLISSFPLAQNTYLRFEKNKQMTDDVKSIILPEGNALSNRAYEFAYYLDKKIYVGERKYIDYVEDNPESIRINSGYAAFMEKNLSGFDKFANEYNLTSLVLAKWQSGYKALRANQTMFLEESGRLNKTYESSQVVVYDINLPK